MSAVVIPLSDARTHPGIFLLSLVLQQGNSPQHSLTHATVRTNEDGMTDFPN